MRQDQTFSLPIGTISGRLIALCGDSPMILIRSLPLFGRYTPMSSILIGASFLSFVVYWAAHFRRELMVVRNLLDYACNLILY